MTNTVPDGDDADRLADSVGIHPGPADPLLEQMRSLQAAFDAKIRYDKVREGFVESMSRELDEHRKGLYQMQLRPLLLDLVAMYDDLTIVLGSDRTAAETATALRFFRDTVEQALARYGVEPFTVDGDAVDRSRQRVISIDETPDPAADRRVARRLRPGFSWNDKVLRPEWVNAYRHVAEPGPDARPGPDAAPGPDAGVPDDGSPNAGPPAISDTADTPETPTEAETPGNDSPVTHAGEGARS